MYIPVTIIVILILLFLVQRFLAKEDKKNHQEIPYMRKLLDRLGWEEEFNSFWKENRNLGEYKALKKFFTQERLLYAREQEKKWEKSDKYLAEERKKQIILKRIFAYQYEDFLFSLFAPLATFDEYEKKWVFEPVIRTPEGIRGNIIRLPEDFVIHKIATYYGFTHDEALSLFNLLENNWCIYVNNLGHYCELGSTLSEYACVVSDNDMDINKWIEQKGCVMTKEQLLAEAEPFNKPSSIDPAFI